MLGTPIRIQYIDKIPSNTLKEWQHSIAVIQNNKDAVYSLLFVDNCFGTSAA
jgi:cystathionine beta-lyase family protein involved in aluminum resistance